MNEDTKTYIKECGPSIRKYWDLHPDEQQWLYPLLQKSLRSAIAVLEAISDRPRTYSEIAKITGFSENTVKQLTYALGEAGIGIQVFSEDRTYCPMGGRKRNLKKLDESSVQGIE
jgi:transcription initiation factor IIE alpha subunit